MDDIKVISISPTRLTSKRQPTFLERLLPIFIILALMLSNLYSCTSIDSFYEYVAVATPQYFFMFVVAILQYLIFLLVLWVYRKILTIRPYYYLVDEQTFISTIKFFFLIKTLIYAGFTFLQFFVPYISALLPIISLILGFLMIVGSYFALKKHIDIMFRHLYFKLMLYPWFVWQAICIILSALGV